MTKDTHNESREGEQPSTDEPQPAQDSDAKAKERQEFFRKLAEVKESITEGVITCW